MHLKPGEKPSGKKWFVDGKPDFGDPSVYVSQMREGDSLPKTDMVLNNYALWLEFGEEKEGKLPGRVFQLVPGGMGVKLAGTLVAELKNEAEQPPQQ